MDEKLMNELVEKVARAICETEGIDPDRTSRMGMGSSFDNGIPRWKDYEQHAQAALSTIRQQSDLGGDDFDYMRVREWALSNPRKAANTAFTASTNRNVAYLIEELSDQQSSVKVDDGFRAIKDDVLAITGLALTGEFEKMGVVVYRIIEALDNMQNALRSSEMPNGSGKED